MMKQKINLITKNPKLNFFLLIFGLVIAVASWVHPFDYNNKSLEIKLIQIDDIISLDNNPQKDDLTLLYKDEEIDNLSHLLFTIRNDGNVPILKEDFLEGLQISLLSDSRILRVNVNPNLFMTATQTSDYHITLDSPLLNQGDVITVSMLVSSGDEPVSIENISLSGRIIGVSDLILIEGDYNDFLLESYRPMARITFWSHIKSFSFAIIMIMFVVLIVSFATYKGENNFFSLFAKYIRWGAVTIMFCYLAYHIFLVLHATVKLVIFAFFN